ncbi:hypothetical protein [Cupriavidus respiraculi]|uniref:hypothetical protein n=1 Tax=Cupriavidus respiraculi TaxID=195930 RepID=UPI002D7F0BEE|nr:hypothetical protein [Cupriavidus respiraculi]
MASKPPRAASEAARRSATTADEDAGSGADRGIEDIEDIGRIIRRGSRHCAAAMEQQARQD